MNTEKRKQLLESYKSAHERLVSVLKPIPRGSWKYTPAPQEWTIHEIVWHLVDSEVNMYTRARRFIAEPGSKVLFFDHNLWTEKLEYHKRDVNAALQLFKYLTLLTFELLQDQPESIWRNTVEHSEYGIMTLDQWLERADKHVNDHIAQIIHNYELWVQRSG